MNTLSKEEMANLIIYRAAWRIGVFFEKQDIEQDMLKLVEKDSFDEVSKELGTFIKIDDYVAIVHKFDNTSNAENLHCYAKITNTNKE